MARRRLTSFRRRGALALAASLFLHSGIWAGVGVYRSVVSETGSSVRSAPASMEVRLVAPATPVATPPRRDPPAVASPAPEPQPVTNPPPSPPPAAIPEVSRPAAEPAAQESPSESPAERRSPDASAVPESPRPERNLTNERNGDSTMEPPRPASPIAPAYPYSARRRGIEGDVLLEVHISSRGNVLNVEIAKSSGNRRLDSAAVDAVLDTAFLPARRNNTTVDDTTLISVTFRLQ